MIVCNKTARKATNGSFGVKSYWNNPRKEGLRVNFRCARKAWLDGKGGRNVTLKFKNGAQRVQLPPR